MVKIGRKSVMKYALGTGTDAPYVEAKIGLKYTISANTKREMNITPQE
jgi:hypothetical protein